MSTANRETENATALLDSDAVMKTFLDILEDSSSSRMNLSSVRSLVLKAFAHPQIFCGFDELKNRCLQLLLPQGENDFPSDSPGRSLFKTLDLFSFGTLKDYKNQQEINNEHFIQLSEAAMAKLSQLTVLACVEKACFDGETSISYDLLGESLGSTSVAVMQEDGASSPASMENSREVEDVLIQCLYANVLKGKLCQRTRSFGWRGEHLPVVLSRDVPTKRISDLLSALVGLEQRLEESGDDATKVQAKVTQGLEETANFWISVQNEKKTSLDEIYAKGSTASGSSTGDGSSSRLFSGGIHDSRTFSGPGNTVGMAPGGGSQVINPRRSSKRSRGGMAGSFLTDTAGSRI
mmetsp:Transcript_21955/g.52259  ORF Transcript_21955/g.52259 Transcript_21955/m.52259 type:complete len:350 (+) Transcript_21955:124-1173(+)|eukprot:CAMPEP_0197173820 /NCGR_PEP_ID=MMETSP1423-20130617/603_1 /TAXON_ID=476441 /ORGANISM="Pseudo-nitzschia heimii, Strain UNC1101" /LENGTH=349 /DNA_ID=CAMNT_0042622685 /DNA_START=122 /DNA_END=1171 /DNA_ORIENTATION=-